MSSSDYEEKVQIIQSLETLTDLVFIFYEDSPKRLITKSSSRDRVEYKKTRNLALIHVNLGQTVMKICECHLYVHVKLVAGFSAK